MHKGLLFDKKTDFLQRQIQQLTIHDNTNLWSH